MANDIQAVGFIALVEHSAIQLQLLIGLLTNLDPSLLDLLKQSQ